MTSSNHVNVSNPSVLDRVNRMNRIIRRTSHDLQEMRNELSQLATMFGIIQPTEDTTDHEPYRQDVPYFTPASEHDSGYIPLTDPLFGRRELEINREEPDGIPRADRS
jgi:hypothetical protein